MNILLWAPFGAGEHYWGPGISAYRLYKSGLPESVNLYLAHSNKNQKKYPDLFKDQFYISGLSKGSRVSQLIFLFNSYFWVKKNYSKFNVVHVLGLYETQFRPALWFEKRKIPAICKVTGENAGLNNHSKLSKLLGIANYRKKKLNHISGYIAISKKIENNLRKAFVDDFRINEITNGVDIKTFKPVGIKKKERLRKELRIKNKFTVLFVGGISRRKQPHLLVYAVRNLIVNEKLPVQLILLGPDRDQDELKLINEIIESNNISDQIIYISNSDNPEKYFQASDLFCLPSKSEGMSNALLEAMACGLPSLVTPVSGSAELISDNVNGFYVSNSDDIRNRVLQLYRNPDLTKEFGKNARNLIERNYKSEIILEQHLELFQRHVQSNHPMEVV